MRYCMTRPILFDFKLDASIFGPSLFGIVRSDRMHLAVSNGSHAFGGYSRPGQIVGHRLGTPTRQLHIRVITADRIGMPRYFDLGLGASHRDRRQIVEHGIGVTLDRRLPGLEQDLASAENVGERRLTGLSCERR